MSASKLGVFSLVLVVASALGTRSQAAPISWTGGDWQWTSWTVGQDDANPSRTAFAPATPSPSTNAQVALQSVASAPTAVSVPDAPAPEPIPVAAPAVAFALSAPVSAPTISASPSSPATVDAFLNLGSGPYPDAVTITTGNAQPWYDSPAVAKLFGGQPTAQQEQDFSKTVLQRVEQAFSLSGVPVTLTTDPTVAAAHTLSVVSNTASQNLGIAIGMTYIGGNGFHFIDQSASLAQSVDQLEWIVAHNLSHELMLSFGVPEVHDKSGAYIDAMKANWSMMLDPNATFSKDAAQDLLSRNFLNNNSDPSTQGAQELSPQPVPEPATYALWTVVLAGAALRLKIKRQTAPRA